MVAHAEGSGATQGLKSQQQQRQALLSHGPKHTQCQVDEGQVVVLLAVQGVRGRAQAPRSRVVPDGREHSMHVPIVKKRKLRRRPRQQPRTPRPYRVHLDGKVLADDWRTHAP